MKPNVKILSHTRQPLKALGFAAQPTRAALVLLNLIDREPKAVMRALAA
jgi:hypothetical protein